MKRSARWPLAALIASALIGLASLALEAAPSDVRVSIYALADGTYNIQEFWVDPGEPVTVTFTNADIFGQHNIVFELDAGRTVSCEPVGLGNSKKLSFLAPTVVADYLYYSSVGADRANGMTGTLHVGTPPTGTPLPTDTPRATTAAPVTGTTTATRTPVPGTPTGSPEASPSVTATVLPPSETPSGGRAYLPALQRALD